MFMNMDDALIKGVQAERPEEPREVGQFRETISKKYDRVSRAVSSRWLANRPRRHIDDHVTQRQRGRVLINVCQLTTRRPVAPLCPHLPDWLFPF